MKYFTKFLSLFFAAAMLLTMAACGSKNTDTDTDTKTGSEKKQLVVATSPDFPPFESLDGSDIVGIEPKLMQAIADKLGMELVWEQVDFDSIIPGIQAGRYDAGVAGISITADRLKNCDFSDPYFLANQVIVALNIAAMSEALTLATKAGVNPDLVYQAIRGGLAGSTVLDAKAPMVMDRNFKPGFRIDLHIKDLANALDTSHGVGAQLPLTAAVMEMMQALRADGLGTADHSALACYYEKLAKVEVTR